MDDSVLRGLAKWPDVPAVYGWLSLDRRGHWRIKGEQISNPTVSAFIGRNYECDGKGRWFFQNGPQRVYVAHEYTPLVYHVVSAENAPLAIDSHIGQSVTSIAGAWIDETGALLIESEHGVGVVHDGDLERFISAFIDANGNPCPETALHGLMELIQEGHSVPVWFKFGEFNVKVEPVRSTEVPARFDFQAQPVAGE